ncbi:kelch-like protein 34 [Monodelphis domestica]|uniref:kelch-like protein 34 n=1 Tax=Monodelphis domestica TaxID=13616 RepID=UPI0000F2CC5F|nr:kelch-like protein 34 [Monodelphis domestica]
MSYFLSYCKAHGGAILTHYQLLRDEGFLCDVKLEAEGSEFLAHRSLLACSSDYFKALFKSYTQESQAPVIRLQVPSATGLQRLLDFIYTAWLPLSMDTLEDTLEAASYLQVSEAVGLCSRYLVRHLGLENCCFAANLASRFGLADALPEAESFIGRHMRELLDRGLEAAGLLELNSGSLRAVLGSSDVPFVAEVRLLNLALSWLQREPAAERLPQCCSLLERIRFGLVPPEVLRRVYSGSGLNLPARVKGLIIQALSYHTATSRQPLMQSEQTSCRSPKTRILLVGGRRAREAATQSTEDAQIAQQEDAGGVGGVVEEQAEEEVRPEEADDWKLTQDVVSFDVYNHRWRSLTRLPAPLQGHCVCTIGSFLYVLGGETPAGSSSSLFPTVPLEVTAQVHRYDSHFHRWASIPTMKEARAHFWCGAVGDSLLAVGGVGADGAALASVEIYDLGRDRWTAARELPQPVYGHAGAVGTCGTVYISGGKLGGRPVDGSLGRGGSIRDVYALSPREKVWSKRAPMSIARFGHHMATLRGAVFAFLGRYELFSEIERYDPGADQWTRLRPLLYDRFCYGLAVVEETALLLGGLKWQDSRQVPTRNVVGYDLDLDCWEDIGCDMPQAWNGLKCAVLQLAEEEEESVEKTKKVETQAEVH